MASSNSVGKKLLPKKLEEDLQAIPKFKPSFPHPKPRTVADMMGDSVERAMYNELVGNILDRPRPIHSAPIPLLPRSPKSGDVNSNPLLALPGLKTSRIASENESTTHSSDFQTSLLTRLAAVEAEAKDLRRQVALKEKLIDDLESENLELRESINDDLYLLNEIKQLKLVNVNLENQVTEMEDFLADYGLVWVGKANSGTQQSLPPSDEISKADFDLLTKKIGELNAATAAEPSKILKNDKKARLVHASELLDTIKVAVYRNGLMIQRGPFRLASAGSCRTFIQDIIDGYFPSEFRSAYPEGVILDLIDKHDVIYHEGNSNNGETSKPLNTQFFLDRLPKTVIRNGNIIGVRSEVSAKLVSDNHSGTSAPMGSNNAAIVVPLHDGHLPTGAASSKASVHILLKWIDGSQMQFHLVEEHTVGDLRRQIQEIAVKRAIDGSTSCPHFEMRSGFPPRLLADNLTMVEAGLVPNGTILTRRLS